jgi:hypothetical protein
MWLPWRVSQSGDNDPDVAQLSCKAQFSEGEEGVNGEYKPFATNGTHWNRHPPAASQLGKLNLCTKDAALPCGLTANACYMKQILGPEKKQATLHKTPGTSGAN